MDIRRVRPATLRRQGPCGRWRAVPHTSRPSAVARVAPAMALPFRQSRVATSGPAPSIARASPDRGLLPRMLVAAAWQGQAGRQARGAGRRRAHRPGPERGTRDATNRQGPGRPSIGSQPRGGGGVSADPGPLARAGPASPASPSESLAKSNAAGTSMARTNRPISLEAGPSKSRREPAQAWIHPSEAQRAPSDGPYRATTRGYAAGSSIAEIRAREGGPARASRIRTASRAMAPRS